MRRAGLLVVATGLLGLAACDSSHHGKASSPSGADAATVRTATCSDWKQTSKAERLRLVIGMRDFFGGQVDTPGVHGQVLPDDRAQRLFDAYCGQSFAGEFQLYRIYGNAAAFTVPIPTTKSS